MRIVLFAAAVTAVSSFGTAAWTQAPAPAATGSPKPSEAQCAENPFKAGCDIITITPGAPGTGLKPLDSGGGISIKGLRPMDQPSFDRNSIRLPKSPTM